MAPQVAATTLEEEFRRLLAVGGGALGRGELEVAREALEDALAIRSRDPQVLGMLGQAFYRLSRYDDAVIAWQRLVDDNPVEPGARVNLGLAWLKARQYDEAVKQLRIALDLNPDHRKAAGYLGLALLEMGRPAQAREYFARTGSDQMVARCDELLAAAAPPEGGPAAGEAVAAAQAGAGMEPVPEEVPAELDQGPNGTDLAEPAYLDEAGVGLALAPAPEPVSEPPAEPAATGEPVAEAPVAEAPAPAPFEPLAGQASSGAAGFDAVAPPEFLSPPSLAQLSATVPPGEPGGLPTLAGFAASRALHGPPGQVFVAEGATLTVNVHGELLCRLAGLAAWRGDLAFSGEVKRFRGRATDKPFGEPPEQMHRVVGDGLVVVRAAGRRFTVLELGGEAGYFREAVVFGFQEAVAFENGRLPSPTGGLDLVHLRGRGRLVLVTRGEPVAVEVTPASPVHVPLASLVGWTGAVTPRIAPLFAGGVDGEAVEISGEGRVLVDPGPTVRSGEGA